MNKSKNVNEIVDEVIISHARDEAKLILSLAPLNDINEFVGYYDKKIFNSCCMHLDTIKYQLVQKGLMEQKETDCFGDIAWMFEEENNDNEK